MKKEDTLNVMEYIDDDIIDEAGSYSPVKKQSYRTGWAVAAACLFLGIVGSVFWVKNAGNRPGETESSFQGCDYADMMAFFIYHGNRYEPYEFLDSSELIGEHVGTASGMIDEWTGKEGYVEFAGSVSGDIYTVKGYDPEFMLCMKYEFGEMQTFVNRSSEGLKKGSDLYENLLHISENCNAVQYETKESWFGCWNELYQMNSIGAVISNFIEQLDEAEITPVPWNENDTTESSMKSPKVIYHMYFKMKDGTTIRLFLYEEAYVCFSGIPDVCVQIQEDHYDELIEVMNNHIESEPVQVISEQEKMKARIEKCKNDPVLGVYIPTYELPGYLPSSAEYLYYIDPKTGSETGVKSLNIDYESETDPGNYYSVSITWKDEYGKFGWAGPVVDYSKLSVEALAEHERIRESNGETWISVGTFYDDVLIVFGSSKSNAQTAFEVLNSVK